MGLHLGYPAYYGKGMKFAAIVNPKERRNSPRPVRVDLRKVFCIGIGLWLVAAAVFGVFVISGYHVLGYLHICFAGIAIGVLLLIWEFFDRSSYRKLGA